MRIKFLLLISGLALVNLTANAASTQDKIGPVYELLTLDVKPRSVKQAAPIYPYSQSQAGLTGTVRIEFIIDVEGRVRNPYVVESNNPAFERPALDAVLKWEFKPGVKDGHPVNVRVSQIIEFQLGNGGDAPWQISKPKNQSNLPPILQWDIAPIPVNTTFPVYPYEALLAGVKGKTRLRFVIGPDGRVTEAKLDEATTPELGLAALAMIDTWRFKPAQKKDGTFSFAALAIEHEFSPSGRGDVPVSHSARDILSLIEKHPEKILKGGQLDQIPKRLSGRTPVYPTALRATGKPGEATIEFFIDEKGDVQLPRIISSSAPEFGYAAAQAVATWRYEPPMKNGKTVVTCAMELVAVEPEPPRPAPPPHP
jgi:TonB family protein